MGTESTFDRVQVEAIAECIGRDVAEMDAHVDWMLVLSPQPGPHLFTVGNVKLEGQRALSAEALSYTRHRAFRAAPRPRHDGGSLAYWQFRQALEHVVHGIGGATVAFYLAMKADDGDLFLWCNLESPVAQVQLAQIAVRHHQRRGVGSLEDTQTVLQVSLRETATE